MTQHFHAVVWMDHRSAQIFEFGTEGVDHLQVKHHDAAHHIHHKSGSIGSGHSHEDRAYLKTIADALGGAHEILVTGPGATKIEFMTYLSEHAPQIASRVQGVEALEHHTGGEIVAYARKYFSRTDRTTPQLS
jgi:stalled ribosome rescue protein Dom34